jgi:hypothetical protein
MTAPRIANAQQGLHRLRQAELDSRRKAGRKILQPNEVATGLPANRVLMTTLGGKLRPITERDLAAFRASIAQLGQKARKGITAAEALSLSRPQDIERAKQEIRLSMLARLQGGKLQLVTSTGPHSKATRHIVNVEFVQFSAAIARPGTPLQAATWLVKDTALKFECTCEHFRFFLRYVATAGGWVAGRAEHGFPKLKNPTLDGACCKHLVRSLTDLQQSAGIRQRIAKMIEAERARIDRQGKTKPRIFTVSQAEAESMLPKASRRITVIKPEQRTGLPKAASAADLSVALKAFQRRTDKNGQAIARALQALIDHQQSRP